MGVTLGFRVIRYYSVSRLVGTVLVLFKLSGFEAAAKRPGSKPVTAYSEVALERLRGLGCGAAEHTPIRGYYCGTTVVLLWYYCGITVVLLWYYCGSTVVVLW